MSALLLKLAFGGIAPPGTQDFTTPGIHYFRVPDGWYGLTFEGVGAGGGGSSSSGGAPGARGGGGAYLKAKVEGLLPGTLLRILVGAGGTAGSGTKSGYAAKGGGGGGLTAVFVDATDELLFAAGSGGGAGGGGYSVYRSGSGYEGGTVLWTGAGPGGGGGVTSGTNGYAVNNGGIGRYNDGSYFTTNIGDALPGTQSGGGIVQTNGGISPYYGTYDILSEAGTNGAYLTGGNPGISPGIYEGDGGGGGAGYYGGAGGTGGWYNDGATYKHTGGGGSGGAGGSSFRKVGSTLLESSNGIQGGDSGTAASGFTSGYGNGGLAASPGQGGRIRISWSY